MIVNIGKEFRFEASHQLPNHDGKCARLHGHSWVLKVYVRGFVNEKEGDPKEGMVMDFADLKAVIQPIVDMLDHRHLGSGYHGGAFIHSDYVFIGTGFPTVPTSENILIWIIKQFPRSLNWQCVVLSETCTSEARIFATDWAEARFIETPQEVANAPHS